MSGTVIVQAAQAPTNTPQPTNTAAAGPTNTPRPQRAAHPPRPLRRTRLHLARPQPHRHRPRARLRHRAPRPAAAALPSAGTGSGSDGPLGDDRSVGGLAGRPGRRGSVAPIPSAGVLRPTVRCGLQDITAWLSRSASCTTSPATAVSRRVALAGAPDRRARRVAREHHEVRANPPSAMVPRLEASSAASADAGGVGAQRTVE